MFYRWHVNHTPMTSTTPVVVGLLGLISVLLVVFLICSQKVSLPGTAINLPSFTNENLTPVVKSVVTVTSDGKLFYNARLLKDVEELKEAFKALEMQESQDKKQVVFYADQRVPLSLIAQLFDVARGARLDAYLATSGESIRAEKNDVQSDNDNSL